MTKNTVLLSFLLYVPLVFAQKNKPIDAFPISKESIMRFKTIEEALGLPASYRLISSSVCFRNKNTIIDAQNLCPLITQGLSASVVGDTIIFSASVVSTKDNKKTLFMTKAYFLK